MKIEPVELVQILPNRYEHPAADLRSAQCRHREGAGEKGAAIAEHGKLASRSEQLLRQHAQAERPLLTAHFMPHAGVDPFPVGILWNYLAAETGQPAVRIVERRLDGEMEGKLGIAENRRRAFVFADRLESGFDRQAGHLRFQNVRNRPALLHHDTIAIENQMHVDVFRRGERSVVLHGSNPTDQMGRA